MLNNGYIETCWGTPQQPDCPNEALLMVGWIPVVKHDADLTVDQKRVSQLVLDDKSDIEWDWTLCCEKHLGDIRDTIMRREEPSDCNADIVFIAQLKAVDYRTRMEIIPEHRELLDYVGEDLAKARLVDGFEADLADNAEDIEAPYGRKADGEPRKKPGRKAAATNQ